MKTKLQKLYRRWLDRRLFHKLLFLYIENSSTYVDAHYYASITFKKIRGYSYSPNSDG